jgi:hypothetical protein
VLYSISNPNSLNCINDVVLTANSKGYFLWVHEENALPKGRFLSQSSNPPLPHSIKPINFIKLPLNYTLCKIQVPDLDQALSAVEFANSYYSLFKVEQNPDVVLDVISKLIQREDEILVAETPAGSAIFVLEPEGNYAEGIQS